MRLHVDIDLQKFVLGPGTTQELTSIDVKRGPATQIEIQFLRGITPQELAADASGIFEVKEVGQYDAEPLTAALAWVKTGTGINTIYTFTLGLVNAALDALLGVEAPVVFTAVAATDLLTSTAHGLAVGDIIQFSSSTTLPAGLEPNTDYFVIASGLTADDFKVSTTLGGSAVDITSTGTGTHSWTYAINDIEEITLMAALEWTADGRTNETQTLDFILENDVVRPGDVPPSTPALVYAVFLPEIDTLAEFKAIPTTGMTLGYLVEILVDVAGTLTWLTYRLDTGAGSGAEPGRVVPNDFHATTNNVHWRGAVGPSGPAGVSAGIPFKWNTSTATTDPGTGKAKVNNATLASATELYISEVDDDGNALAALLGTWDDGTSTIRGRVLFQDPATPANFAVFDITGTRTDNGLWDTFTITPVTSGGTLTNNLPLRVFFSQKGDKGDQGDAGFKYQFNTATAGDPGTGKFLFNHATFLSATSLLISETDGNANGIAAVLAAIDNSTSANKCRVLALKQGGTAFFEFYITAVLTDNGAYDTFPITPISSSGAIANNDIVYLNFVPVGDLGATGPTGPVDSTAPQNIQNAAYTLVLTDAGKHIFHDEVTARTWTIPANGSVAFPIGTIITLVNNNGAGNITLAITTDTLRRGDGTAGTGSRTITPDSIATILKSKATEWQICGVFT